MANINGVNKIVVKAPIQEVFEKFNDPNLQNEWSAQSYTLRDYKPPFQKGTTYTVAGKFMGQATEFKYEVVAFDPPKQVVLKLKGSGTGLITHSFKTVSDGTEVDFDFNRDFSGWLTSRTALDIHNALYKQITADLQSFKQFAEA